MSDDDNTLDRRRLLALTALGMGLASVATAQEESSAMPEAKRLDLPPQEKELHPTAQFAKLTVERPSDEANPLKRTEAEQATWETVSQLLSSQNFLTADGSTYGALAPALADIASGFSFKQQPEDIDFSSFHVESLLDQAADLFDRAIRDRASWDDLIGKYVELLLELHEFRELDAIHQEEEASGIYEVEAKEASSSLWSGQADYYTQGHLRWLAEAIRDSEFSSSTINSIYNQYRYQAFTYGLVPYYFKNQDFDRWASYSVGGVSKQIYKISLEAAEVIVRRELELARGLHAITTRTFEGNESVTKRRLDGLDARADWESSNSNFRRRRTATARKLEEIKARLAVEPEGPLNYGKRLQALQRRFQQDFRDGLARLQAAAKGLHDLYRYTEALPPATSSTYFDDCLLWNRQAIQWLVRFAQREQNVVLPVSLRDLLGDKAWKAGRKKRSWSVDLPKDLLVGSRHLRLRGIAAFATGPMLENTLWRVRLTPPIDASILDLDGQEWPLKQKGIPDATLARVCTRNHQREPDVVGIVAFHNLSPFGQWQVVLESVIPRSTPISRLEDLTLELHLAYRSPR